MRASRSAATVVAAAVAGLLTSIGLVAAAASWEHRDHASAVVEAGRSRAAFARDRDALLRRVPPDQAAALRDWRVTPAEYEAAVRRTMRCLADDLLAARPTLAAQPPSFIGPAWSDDHFTYAYEFRLAADDLDPRPLDRSCQERFSRSVETLFHLQRWTDPAFMARSSAALHACLDAARLPGRGVAGPRARFRAVLADPSVGDQEAIEARKCIGARPSIGDLTP